MVATAEEPGSREANGGEARAGAGVLRGTAGCALSIGSEHGAGPALTKCVLETSRILVFHCCQQELATLAACLI